MRASPSNAAVAVTNFSCSVAKVRVPGFGAGAAEATGVPKVATASAKPRSASWRLGHAEVADRPQDAQENDRDQGRDPDLGAVRPRPLEGVLDRALELVFLDLLLQFLVQRSLPMVRLEGLEPPTLSLGCSCSIQLSYRRS